MKKLLLLILLVLSVCGIRAQRFFYIENNKNTDQIIRDGLLGASQFVCPSPLGSDYIIKTDIGFQEASNILTLHMTLEDSVTFQTIFQTQEEYKFGVSTEKSRIFLRMAITNFIEKNIGQIIACSKSDHYDSRMKYLRPKKDKT